MSDFLASLRARHLAGEIGGLIAVCSAHPMVLDASLALAAAEDRPLLVEATASQVNLEGGYTGMTPAAYVRDVRRRARAAGLPDGRLLIGADHLGPYPWRRLPAQAAMQQAMGLARECAAAGFDKLHLDASMPCADDPGDGLPSAAVAARTVALCQAAEAANPGLGAAGRPLYVIGADVPTPGGGLDGHAQAPVTSPQALVEDIEAFRRAFAAAGLIDAWRRVMAVVVQPGIDFGDAAIGAYQPERAAALSAIHDRLPADLAFEVHAADFQPPTALRRLVADHFCLLKIGPCLTFALREALYALAHIENRLPGVDAPSNLAQVMEDLMTARPAHWQDHYRGGEAELRFLRHFSYRDRIRYYWSHPAARRAVDRLFANLAGPVPAALLRQYLPDRYGETFRDADPVTPLEIIRRRIQGVLKIYVTLFPGSIS
jgi:D-tagatose-1,6-bisphosphate aldolase subunit GatZ/KbaZ